MPKQTLFTRKKIFMYIKIIFFYLTIISYMPFFMKKSQKCKNEINKIIFVV